MCKPATFQKAKHQIDKLCTLTRLCYMLQLLCLFFKLHRSEITQTSELLTCDSRVENAAGGGDDD